ncbi:alpha/beta fold hydrolase [Halosegnis marinus]
MTADERRKLDDAVANYYDVEVDYDAVTAPSCHLYGEYEIPQVRRHARFMAERLDGDLRVIPDAGHVSMVDAPEFVVGALRDFLDGAL